jgi:hypothetical protein
MVFLLAISLLPVSYGGLYLMYSIRHKRFAQAAAIAVPMLLLLGMLAVLLWEFLRLP